MNKDICKKLRTSTDLNYVIFMLTHIDSDVRFWANNRLETYFKLKKININYE